MLSDIIRIQDALVDLHYEVNRAGTEFATSPLAADVSTVEKKAHGLAQELGVATLQWLFAGGSIILRKGPEETRLSLGESETSMDGLAIFLTHAKGRHLSEIQTMAEFSTELETLFSLVEILRRDEGLSLPEKAKKMALEHIVARARYLQDDVAIPESNDEITILVDVGRSNLRDLFTEISRHAKMSRAGYIRGLQREHEPEFGDSWLDDAEVHFRALEALK